MCVNKHHSCICYLILLLLVPCFISGVHSDRNVIQESARYYNVSLLNYNVTSRPGYVIKNFEELSHLSTIIINVVDIPKDVRFVLAETHSYEYNVTLSYKENLEPHLHVNGTNIGLVQENIVGKNLATFYLHNSNKNVNISVLITVQAYGNAPIPGGCNMEFAVETAPYLIMDFTDSMVLVNSQPASAPERPPKCESQIVEYEMYHMYQEERDFSQKTYFDALLKMMNVRDIQLHGKKVPEPIEGSKMRRIFSAYPGTGSVYALIAKSGTSASAYVPVFTYSCNTVQWSDSCDVLKTTFSKILCAVIFFLGLFVCFYGHHFFKTEMFLLGFLSGGLVSYILIALCTSFSGSVTIVISVVMGICFGSFWYGFWWYYGIPVYSVLLATMTLGFIIAGIASYAWLGDVDILRNDLNFWLVYVCIILTVPILFSSIIHRANMISCAVLGAYAVIIPIDHYIGSNLKFIILNIVRRATVKDFRLAIIDPPFQVRDIVLCILWLALATVGIGIQWYKHRGKPPFPPPPYLRYRERSQQRSLLQRFMPTERTPLLSDASAPPELAPNTTSNESVLSSRYLSFFASSRSPAS